MNRAGRGLKPYFVPQAGCPVKLNQNESPFDVRPEIKERIFARLRKTDWNRYPPLGAEKLLTRLARYTDFPEAGIVLGNGSNEIIQTVLLAACEPGDPIAVVEPGFSTYPRLGRILGLEVRTLALGKNFRFDPDAIIAASRGARLVIIASPNNPTGTALTLPELEKMARAIAGYLVIDEAYYEFAGVTGQPLIRQFAKLMIIRTFSKAFGLAGARLGYLLARPEIAETMNKVKLPFSVGFFQQACGAELLQNRGFVRETVATIKRERGQMFRSMSRIRGLQPIPSRANFILFRVRTKPAAGIFDGLRKKGVLVRNFDGPGLKNWLRVTVGRPAENRAFLAALKALMEGR